MRQFLKTVVGAVVGTVIIIAAILLIAGQLYEFFFLKAWNLDDWVGFFSLLIFLVITAGLLFFETRRKRTPTTED
jgi:divalent metal cation (Fe/Co/Zn/Cd) transporter